MFTTTNKTKKKKGTNMKMNIKGLVFVGFAAAVFASAANAAGEEKTVTSLKYTEATYQAKTAANQADKVLKMASNTAGDIGYATVDTTVTADSPNLITSGAVASYVDTAGGNFQTLPGNDDGQKVAKAGGGWEALDTDTTPTSGSTKPVTSGGVATALSGKQDAALVTTIDSSSDNTHYPSAKAVYDLTNGITIPAPAAGTCGTNAPCALVLENGTASWEPIQQ